MAQIDQLLQSIGPKIGAIRDSVELNIIKETLDEIIDTLRNDSSHMIDTKALCEAFAAFDLTTDVVVQSDKKRVEAGCSISAKWREIFSEKKEAEEPQTDAGKKNSGI